MVVLRSKDDTYKNFDELVAITDLSDDYGIGTESVLSGGDQSKMTPNTYFSADAFAK